MRPNRTCLIVCLLAALLAARVPALAGPAPRNVLANPTFEVGEGDAPAGWSFRADIGKATGAWDGEEAAEGKRSLRIDVPEKAQADWRMVQAGTPVESGRFYTLSGRMWSSQPGDDAAALEAQWFSGGGYLSRTVVAPSKAKTWERLARRGIQPPKGAVSAVILFRGYQAGTYRLDDVFFGESDAVDVGNLLQNGGFEEGPPDGAEPEGWALNPNAPQFGKETGAWNRSIGESSAACVLLRSEKPDVTPYWYQGKVRLAPEQRYELTFFVKAKDFGTEYRAYVEWVREGKVVGGKHMQWEQSSTWWQRKSLVFSTPPALMDTAYVVLQARPGTVWFDNVKLALVPVTEAAAPPVALTLLAPHYRDTIYATQRLDAIRAAVRTDRPVGKGALTVALLDGAGKRIHTQQVKWAGGQQAAVQVPVPGLKPGRYRIQASLAVGGKPYGKAERAVRKLAPYTPEVRVREDRVTLIDGKPFWPIGVTTMPVTPESYKKLADAGFNLMVPSSVSSDPATARRVLRLAASYGLYVMDWNNGHCYPADRVDAQTQREKTRRSVESVRGLPGFLGWMIDETLWNGVPVEDVRRYYEEVTAADPHHLVWNNHAPRNTLAELTDYNRFTDVSGSDIYPVPEPQAHSDLPNTTIAVTGDETRKLIRTVNGSKPIWMILQGFGWNDWEKDPATHRRRPTWAETRFMAYDAIISGADGIVYWGANYVEQGAELWTHLDRIAGELKALTGALVLPDAPGAASLVGPAEGVRIRAKQLPGGSLVMVENATAKSKKVRFRLAKAPKGAIPVLFEERSVQAPGGVIEEEFAPYTAHLYLTAAKLPDPLVRPRGQVVPDAKPESLDTVTLGALRKGVWAYRFRGQWMWEKSASGDGAPSQQEVYFRRSVRCEAAPREAILLVTADNEYELFVNGKPVGSDLKEAHGGWRSLEAYEVAPLLRAGENEIAIRALNTDSAAGVLVEARIAAGGKPMQVLSGEGWEASAQKPPGWPATAGGSWTPVRLLGVPPVAPWSEDLIVTPAAK